MSVSIAVRIEDFGAELGNYRQVTIFAGPDENHVLPCGYVIMKAEEAEDLQRRVDAGEVIEPMRSDVATPLYDEASERERLCVAAGKLRDVDGDYWVLADDNLWHLQTPEGDLVETGVPYEKIAHETKGAGPVLPITKKEGE